jgi:PAS domain S-box-containing protein
MNPASPLEEIRRLRRTMRDLVALSTLPAVWTGLGAEGIARSLADVLLGTLSLDLIYIRLTGLSGAAPIEVVRNKRSTAVNAGAVRAALDPWLRGDQTEPPDAIIDSFGDETLHLAVTRFGVSGDDGILVAGSSNPNFPTEQDRLLLGVGANQTAIVLQRRRAEEQVHEHREWLRVTLASIGDAVIATDTQGRVAFLNSVAQELTGFGQDDAESQPLETIFTIVHERTREPVENPVERVLREGVVVGLGNHTVLIARNGTERPIDDSAAPIRDASGKMLGVVLIFRDVTKQRRVEQQRNVRLAVTQALSEAASVQDGSAAVLRAVCENLRWDVGFFWTVNDAGTALVCSESWERPDCTVDEFKTASRNRTFTKGEGLPGRVWTSGRPAWVVDITHDGNFARRVPALRYGLHSAFACPVAVGARVLGVIEFFTRRIHEPDADLLETIETVAGNVGQFIERKTAEDELRRSEQQLADFFENATVGLHWVGPDGIILRANRAELEMLGYDRDEYVGRPIAEFHADESVICDILRRLKAGEKLTEYPARLRCKDGTIKDVLIDSSVLWRDGDFVHTRCFTRDVTERRRAEQEIGRLNRDLQRRVTEFQTLLDVIPIGIAVAEDPGCGRIWSNPAMTHLLHLDSGDNISLSAPADERPAFRVFEKGKELRAHELPMQAAIATEQVVRGVKHDLLLHDGTWMNLLNYAVPLYDEAGKVRGGLYVGVDITEHERAQQALREADRRFRAVFNQQFQFMAILAQDGTVLEANDTCFRATGVGRERALGRPLWETPWWDGLPMMQARLQESIADVLRTGEPVAREIDYLMADGSLRHATAVVTGIADEAGRVKNLIVEGRDDTDRQRAEKALRMSEQRWRTMAEALPNLLWTDLPDGQCDWLSSQWGRYTGIPESELLGLHWLERVIHPDDRQRTLDCWQAACADQGDYDLEYRIRRHDGEYRWFKTRGVPVRDDGRIVYWFRTCTDIEDHKRAEISVRESEQRFRQLADAMPQIVWTAGPDGNIDYLNRRWTEFTGLEQTVGNEAWGLFLHPGDGPRANVRWASCQETGAPFEMELRLLDRRQQTYRWHLMRTVAVRDATGAVARWFGTSTDIHAQKRAEESSRFLAQASAELADMVDYETTLEKVANLAVPYFADWSAVDLAGEEGSLRRLAIAHQDRDRIALVRDLMREYPPDPESHVGAFAVLRSGRPEIVEEITDDMLIRGAKDERHLQLIRSLGLRSYICVPLVIPGKTLGLVTFATAESGRRYTEADLALAMDLAHRAAVAIENTQLFQALRDADRRKDEFLATLAHELRNPLAPIRNALQILKMPRVDSQTAERSREMMERQIQHLVRLVDDLLDVSRVMRGKIELRRERVELATIVARAIETVQPLVDAQCHELCVRVSAESLALDADPVRLTQVLGNLLTNAAKYTDSGGCIWLTAERDGDMAVLRVRDNGIGIDPRMLPTVFELFVQADHASTKAQGGLGIGLTLVKNLVEMHNGVVQARSEGLGKGCEFTVRLPLMAQPLGPDHVPRKGGRTTPPPSPSGKRLLVVDDNEDAANSLAMLLRLQGHEARVAFSGVAALEMTKVYTPDAAFLDIGMPGMDGYEVARRIRQQPGLGGVVLAALTGWGQQEDRRRTAEAGFNYHLVKPLDPDALEKLLAELKRFAPR